MRYGQISLKRPRTDSPEQNSTTQASEDKKQSTYSRVELENLEADPGLRKQISDYHPNDRDAIRRAYLLKGPCQPRANDFKQQKQGKALRGFNDEWFDEFSNWLEFSIEKEAAFCLCCYLMREKLGKHGKLKKGGDCFVSRGFKNWKKKDRLQAHVGGPRSAHNQAWSKCQALMDQRQHIVTSFSKQSTQTRKDYRTRLTATIDCVRFFLRLGLAFRGHDEFNDSLNQGSCKHQDILREKQASAIIEALSNGEITSGHGLNQERSLSRPGDTRWGSNYANGICGLAKKLVQTRKNVVYQLVYMLMKLTLIFPVATATVERAFSAMNIVKNNLRNWMGDQWMNDCLVTYIENEIFAAVDNEKVIQRFQKMKTRREQL